MYLKIIFLEYLHNFKSALLFGLLLVFVGLFSFLDNVSFSSGSVFLEYSTAENMVFLIAQLFVMSLFLAFLSLFVSLIILAVKKDVRKMRIEYYLTEMLQKFTSKIFIFYLSMFLFLYFLSFGLYSLNVSPLFVNAILIIVSLPFLFVPQAIVVDEGASLSHAIADNFDFIRKNSQAFFAVLAIGLFLVALTLIIEYLVDLLSFRLFFGRIVSHFLILIFVVPFLETMKTYYYVLRFSLIKKPESVFPAVFALRKKRW